MPSFFALMQQRLIIPILFIAILLIFFADSITQLGFAHGVLYTPLVLLAGLTFRQRILHITSMICILALWLGYLVSPEAPEGFANAYVIANRVLATLAIALLWWLSFQAIGIQRQQQQQHQEEQQARLDLSLAHEMAALSHWRFDDYQKMVILDKDSGLLLSQSETELTLGKFIGCFAPKSQTQLKEKLQLCLTKQQTVSLETQLTGSHSKWVKLVAYPDPTNRDMVRGLLQNIEQHYQESHLILAQQQRLQQIVDSLPVKVWTANDAGIIDFVSNTFVDFCGKSASDIISHWVELIHPDDQADTLQAWHTSVTERTPYKVEFRIQKADGSYQWHLTSALPVYNPEGKLYWFGSAMDISKQKSLWLETDQLKQSLYQILENVSDAFVMLDSHFHLSYLNQRALALLSNDKLVAPGCHMTEVLYHPQTDFSPLLGAIQRAFQQQLVQQLWFTLPEQSQPAFISVYPTANGVNLLLRFATELKSLAAISPLNVGRSPDG